MTHPDLAGKAAIVTGAGAGIGLAIALRLADEGCSVLCADIDGDAAEAAASKIGGGAIGHGSTSSDEAQVIGMVEACVDAFGGVDKLVANAGVVHFAPLTETTVDDFDRVIRINLRGAWLCTKHAAPAMVDRGGGAIVNMSSLAGQIAAAGSAAYGMSKAGDHPPQPRHRRRIALGQRAFQRGAARLRRHTDAADRDDDVRPGARRGRGEHDDRTPAGPHGRTGGDRRRRRVPAIG